jgi:hypothetical protein
MMVLENVPFLVKFQKKNHFLGKILAKMSEFGNLNQK